MHQATPVYRGVPEVPGVDTDALLHPRPALSLGPGTRQSLHCYRGRGCSPAWWCRVPGAVRPRRGSGARALTAYLRAAAAPRLQAGLRRARLGCAGLRARPPRASAAPARSSAPPDSAPPGGAPGARWRPTRRGVGAGRAGGRAPAAGAAPGRPAAAWKLLIWAVMSGEVAGAGPPTSFHSLPRVSCRPARGTPVPALLGRLSARLASAPPL